MDSLFFAMAHIAISALARFVTSCWSDPLDGEIEIIAYIASRVERYIGPYEISGASTREIVQAALFEYLLLRDAQARERDA